MGRITLCNMVSTRRRSASDLFLENGIWILKEYLETRGHDVTVLDLATNSFYREINPRLISRCTRNVYGYLFRREGRSGGGIGRTILFTTGLCLQWLSRGIRTRRMRRKLRAIARQVGEERAKLFGIKVWYGEAFCWADELCRMVHEASPGTIVIAGGFHPTLYEGDFMAQSSFDIAVTGEGEEPLEELLRIADRHAGRWDKKEVLREVSQRIRERRVINTLMEDPDKRGTYLHERRHPEIIEKAIPRYEIEKGEKLPVHIVVDSLGCAWGKCSFCVHSQFFDKMAPRRVERIVDELESMTRQGIRLFRFSGSDTYPSFGAPIAEAIIRRGLDISYSIGARASTGEKSASRRERVIEEYRTMIESGMCAVFMGGETGNDWINEHVMNKGVRREDLIWTMEVMREAEKRAGKKIYISLALIYPCPTLGEVRYEEIYGDNLSLVEASRPDAVMVTPPAPFIQTSWYREREKYGFEIGQDFIGQIMRYEYVMYKPVSLWEELNVGLEGRGFREIMEECGRMRKGIEAIGIDTDVSDEHFLMQIAAGYTEKPHEFKRESMLDIVSGDYRWLEEVGKKINGYSGQRAEKRHPIPDKDMSSEYIMQG